MKHRIHILGCAPRSGTTLLTELFLNGFQFDAHSEHEMSMLEVPDIACDTLCSKNPTETSLALPMLFIESKLWIVYVMRDPRDVIVSKHGMSKDQYFSNLRLWKGGYRWARRAEWHPRFISIKYEDMVTHPDAIQEQLLQTIPFLKKKALFSEYHKHAKPSQRSLNALLGVRPIANKSVGRWKESKTRVASQLAVHGPITEELITLGYEKDDAWLSDLPEIQELSPQESSGGVLIDKLTPRMKYRGRRRQLLGLARYFLGFPRKREIITASFHLLLGISL